MKGQHLHMHNCASQEHIRTYTHYSHQKNASPNIKNLSNNNCTNPLQNDPITFRFSKRMNYKFPPSNRVLDSSLLNQEKHLIRNMSANITLKNTNINTNGAWSNLMNKTNNESTIMGQTKKRNPKMYQSQLFNIDVIQPKEKRHSKEGQYTDHGQTTQIYHLPGGVKRNADSIVDDSRKVPSNPHYATIIKHNKDFGPLYVPKDNSNFKDVNVYLGTYATRYRNESHVLVNCSKKYPDAFEVLRGKKCDVKSIRTLYTDRFGIRSANVKCHYKRREPPIYNNQFRSQIIIN